MKRFCKKYVYTIIISAVVLLLGCSNNGSSVPGNTTEDWGTLKTENPKTFVPGTTSVEMAKNMTIGWNLGNTFDATGFNSLACENAWGQPTTTKAMIHGIKEAGFVSIRIPVSWHDHIVNSMTYKIDEAWINRVKQVVDWSLEEGLCVIINMHHDNFTESQIIKSKNGYAVGTNETAKTHSINYIAGVWANVAEAFKDYDYNLVFELLNEPRDVNGEVWKNEWWVGGADAISANSIISSYEQAALDKIRATGSKNADRFILVPAYAGSTGCMTGYELPKDSANDRLIIETHAYTPYSFAMEAPGEVAFTSAHKSELKGMFNMLYNNYVSKGIGVIIDETGVTDKHNLSDRINWATYFFGEAYKKGIPCFWWDNGSYSPNGTNFDDKYGYYNRVKQVWYFPSLIKASLEAVAINSNFDNQPAKHESTVNFDISDNYSLIKVTGNNYDNAGQFQNYVCNYQTVIDVPYSDFPVTGDTLIVTWKGISDIDIKNIYLRPVDNSAAANYWMELTDNTKKVPFASDIKAGEPFCNTFTYTFTKAPVGQVGICITYDIEDADAEATITSTK